MLVQIHVYLWRHFLETLERVQPGVASEYALKTRTASAVCRVRFCGAEAQTVGSTRVTNRISTRGNMQPGVAPEYD